MNNEQQELLNEAYENYKDSRECQWTPTYFPTPYTQEEFINKCKTDNEFSEKWGLKIDERELSLEERMDLSREKRRTYWNWQNWSIEEMEYHLTDVWNIPTRLITITYKGNTIESYV